MANWLYTLPIKDLLTEAPDADYDADAVKIAPEAAKRVRSLMEKVKALKGERALDRIGDLYIELDEVADMLDDVATTPESASSHFNEALEMLYDLGDRGHRVWVK